MKSLEFRPDPFLQRDEILQYLNIIKPMLISDGIESVGLFGSYAKDSADESSDIDVCNETTNEFVAKFKGWSAFVYLDENLRKKLANKFHKKVDLFDLNSDAKIKKHVTKEAIYV